MTFSFAVLVITYLGLAAALVATFRRALGKGLSCLRWYLLVVIASNAVPSVFLREFGVRSHQYSYAYYACDLAATILGFFVLARLVEVAFENSSLKLPRLRLIAILLFTGVSVGSAAVVYLSRGSLSTGSIGAAFDQNFSFLGMVLAIILFVAMNAMFLQGVRFRRVVLSFSIMYSASAIVWSLMAIAPGLLRTLGIYVIPMVSVGTIALLAYTLWVPEGRVPSAAKLAKVQARLKALEGQA